MTIDAGHDPDIELAGLRIWVSGREFPEATDFWDGNWLVVRAELNGPGCLIEIRGPYLRADSVVAFADALANVSATLSGTAILDLIEPNLIVTVTCGSLGKVSARIEMTSEIASQAHSIVFDIDQSYLDKTIRGCRRLLERYPPIARS